MSYYQKCEVCGIDKEGDTFFYSHNNTPTDGKGLFTRVCQFAKNLGKKGCINTCNEIDPNKRWLTQGGSSEELDYLDEFTDNYLG